MMPTQAQKKQITLPFCVFWVIIFEKQDVMLNLKFIS